MRIVPSITVLILLWATLPVQAQVPPVANAPASGADFLRSGGAEPDTTAPWRYFPLHVGDAWEYYGYTSGARRRVDVLGEETVDGRDYVTWRSQTYNAAGEMTGGFGTVPVRFDSLDALARFFVFALGEESFLPLPSTECPLDAAFGSEVICPATDTPFAVGGGYDGLLVFGTDLPGTGQDTVRTAVKTYLLDNPGASLDLRYGANLGLLFTENESSSQGLYYARVNGVEYGQAVYPVASEAGPGVVPATLALSVYPNPFGDDLSVEVRGAAVGEAVRVEVLDVLGREVVRREVVRREVVPGAQVLRLSGAGLAPGLYVVRARTARGAVVTRKVLKR